MWLRRLIRLFGLWRGRSGSSFKPSVVRSTRFEILKTTNHTLPNTYLLVVVGEILEQTLELGCGIAKRILYETDESPSPPLPDVVLMHGFGYTYFKMQPMFGTTDELPLCSSDHLDP
ncbi:hypothetical protein OCU04_000034 [Sclerotinia nivalis]|uniref:Uncharacterized protein n=1 Tax=Sclerotinia nivalis TaxID=352851 RepID=A0A9X0AV94_9HELO|nr:hypothetical protein OCU04_000034 [Sclerotinia nivalis]